MAKEKNMDDLKKELEMDEHRIPLELLLDRLKSNAQTVKLQFSSYHLQHSCYRNHVL